jgi:integrase
MAKRRGNNEGSLYQRKNGSWRAQITLCGKRLAYSAKTRKECQGWLKKTISQIDDGMTYASTGITLEAHMSSWLSSIRRSVRNTTWTQYERATRIHINPFFGKKKVRDLRTEHIQALYNSLLENNIGVYAVLKVHDVLQSALTQAVRMGIISRNPATFAIRPKRPSKEMKIYDESQVSRMLVAAKDHRWEALYNLAVTTGMRQSELLGLKWVDVDWRQNSIQVERQLLRTDAGEGIHFAQLKTKNSRRMIALGKKTADILRAHNEKQHAKRQAAGDNWVEHGLIFTNSFGGPINHSNLRRNYIQLLKDAGLPHIRFHDLRHTAASLLLNHGIPVIIVSRRLGHAKPSITLDIYGHLVPSMQNEAAELMDDLVMPIMLHPIAPNCTKTAPESGN